MSLLLAIITCLALLAALLLGSGYVLTRLHAASLSRRYPNIGELTDVGSTRINSFHWPRPATADLPALVFIHGASGNLRDPMGAFFEPLKARAEMLFVDRPGHGYSERGGDGNLTPDGQADAIAAVMRAKGIERAIIVGHSFGGATTATFALRHKHMAAGLLFLAPATHPWPGGVDWYYNVASLPVIGALFCATITLPAGLLRMRSGIAHVFKPNPVPENYADDAAIPLMLRPGNFRSNARDVAGLHAHVTAIQPRYREIEAPAIILTGDSDDIVYEELHSRGLKRDIPRSELYRVRNLGHKPDYVATELAISALENLAGAAHDLESRVRELERRITPVGRVRQHDGSKSGIA